MSAPVETPVRMPAFGTFSVSDEPARGVAHDSGAWTPAVSDDTLRYGWTKCANSTARDGVVLV